MNEEGGLTHLPGEEIFFFSSVCSSHLTIWPVSLRPLTSDGSPERCSSVTVSDARVHQPEVAIHLTAHRSGPVDLKVIEGQDVQEKAALHLCTIMAETPPTDGSPSVIDLNANVIEETGEKHLFEFKFQFQNE